MGVSKIKIFMATGGTLALAGLLVLSVSIINHRRTPDNRLGQNFDSSQSAALDGGASSGGSNAIPLNQAGPAPNDTGGLSVSSSNAAASISQLDGSARASAGSNTGTGSSSAPKELDPTTFAEYEKYKDSQGALFGDMQVGNGTELTAGHKAAVYYKGWLTNGQLFDESRPGSDGKLQPFILTLGAHQVISGWEQGINGMKVGGTRLLIIPPAVGYGATGQGSIPPNAVLVFQVQLAAVE